MSNASSISNVIREAQNVIKKIEDYESDFSSAEKKAAFWWEGLSYNAFKQSWKQKEKNIKNEKTEISRLINQLQKLIIDINRAEMERERAAKAKADRERAEREKERERKNVISRGRV